MASGIRSFPSLVLTVDTALCGRPAVSVRIQDTLQRRPLFGEVPSSGSALTAADGSIWCVLFCDIVALCLSLLRDRLQMCCCECQ